MPWLVGDERSYRLLETGPDLALADLWSESECLYLGYLLEGFIPDLLRERVPPPRMGLAFRAGWSAVAVTARTPDPALASRLGPFLAPATPRPHSRAPLGFTLFHKDRLAREGGGESLPALQWACRLTETISRSQPVFCDPVLEMSLPCLSQEERRACRYRPPRPWARVASALAGLGGPR